MRLRRILRGTAAAALGASLAATGLAAGRAQRASTLSAVDAYGKLPLRFEAAAGAAGAPARFVARGLGYGLWLEPAAATVALRSADGKTASVRMRLQGGNGTAPARAEGLLPGVSNYLVGPGESWRTDVPGFGRVRYAGVYPGVDIVYYGNQGKLEYDFLVAPGADPSRVRLALDGAERLAVDPSGALVIGLRGGELRLEAPVAFQETPAGRSRVESRYELAGADGVSLAVGAYDRSLPLVIDPVLAYSTYLGGSLDDSGRDIAVDAAGNAYVTGETVSNDFPLEFPIQTDPSNFLFDAFVTKINPAGTALVYSTYLGGNAYDGGTGIAVDAAGNAYVSGYTNSTNFATTLGPQLTYAGGAFDGFVTKINAAGTQITYSTYLGGAGDDRLEDIVVTETTGVASVVGTTSSTDYPTVAQFQQDPGDANFDVVVSQLNTAATGAPSLVYSTYVGGSGADAGRGIALGGTGQLFITGETTSSNFPTTVGAVQATAPGGLNAFVARLNPGAIGPAQVQYSSYLGGSGDDSARRVAADAAGNAYVVGVTASTNYPTQGAFQLEGGDGGGFDAFVTKVNTAATTAAAALVYSTYLGGTGQDDGTSIAVDPQGGVVVVGATASTNFPTVGALQTDPTDSAPDAFVTRLNTSATGPASVVYSTYLGGAGNDAATGVAAAAGGAVYVTGYTCSNNFPTTSGAPQLSRAGGFDAFVTKLIDAVADVSITKTSTPDPVVQGQNVTYTISVFNSGPNPATGVVVTEALPTCTTFFSVSPSQGTCTAPAAGAATGTVTCSVGTVASNTSATVTVVLKSTGNPGTTISNTATVSAAAQDPTPANNTATETTAVISPIAPPVITGVTKLKDPFRVKITGSNFQPGVQVFIGSDAAPWPNVKYKGTTMLVLKGGSFLKARFPNDVPVTITVRNPDGGVATTTFARKE